MADSSRDIDLEKLFSLSTDLVKVLCDKKDVNNFTFCHQPSQALQLSCDSEFAEVQKLLQDAERKIEECKKKTEEANSETIADEEMERLQRELESELEKECTAMENLRASSTVINDLDHQRISIEEKMKVLKKYEKSRQREKMALSMYASVTNIIPILGDESKAEGYMVNRQKKVVDKFEFNLAETTSYDACTKIWNMLDKS